MAYTILKTNGEFLTRVADGSINSTATSVTLLGRDFTGYGQYYNENLVTLLSNSAKDSPPTYPIQGELWYDTLTGQLKIYDNAFKNIGAATISDTYPIAPSLGDFWYDSARAVLNFFSPNGTISLSSFPVADTVGWVNPTVTIIDTSNVSHPNVTLLFNVDPSSAVGVLSDSSFVANADATQLYLTASGQITTNIVQGLNIFGGIQTTGDVTVGGTIHTASTTGTPTNTSTPAKWLKMVVGGANYYVPLYQ